MFLCTVFNMRATLHGAVTLPKDVVRQEANRANNERQHAWRQRRRLWSAARAATRARGEEETPSKPESSRDDDEEEDEDEEEGEITPMTPSFHSPPHEDLTSLTW
jgi:hypothetical protein